MNDEIEIIKQYESEIEDIRNKMRLCQNNPKKLQNLRAILSSTTFSLHLLTNQTIHTHATYFFDEAMMDYLFFKNKIILGTSPTRLTAYQYRYLRYLLASIRKVDRIILIEKYKTELSSRKLAIQNKKTLGYINYHLYKAINSCRVISETVRYSQNGNDSNEVMLKLRKEA
ncbi:hypothetical protein [Lentilactobacillus sp. SPB1-3]|uniref:Uncharacterized protein n=1 Tax=Lentilactobacillus terminaliae TaxID=3003483 RepID=A0ACD5DGR6_9LACO|nr:hypothetical protein [Lentilactobacillus sp. SPB1-3]MCZ0976677.1 hypothetical protein [Lentilactobacillus sp. SPB1-3]